MSENANPNVREEKMFYMNWWFWAIMAGLILGLVVLLGPGKGTKDTSTGTTTGTSASVTASTTVVATTTTSARQEVVLLDTAYSMDEDGEYLRWAVEYQNPEGNSSAYDYPKIIITAYDGSGAVLATEDQSMNGVQPGEKQVFGSSMDCHGQTPAKVDFAIESGTPKTPDASALKSSDFQIEGVNERYSDYGSVTYTGTIKNNGQKDTNDVCVAVALRQDGKLVYSAITFVDGLAAGQQKAFEIGDYNVPAHNSYEVIAYDWGF